MFADDTCLFVPSKDHKLAQVAINRDLDLIMIRDWAHQWLVTFSPPKTESMLVSKQEGLGLHC